MTTPEPSDFLLLPIRDFDLIIVYRASDISKPYYINYREFIKAITANITPASALLLQTNGFDNPTQSLLNLVQGTGITITDDGSGNITITNTGSGGTYTASNGVYESPSGNFTLGSSTFGPSVFTSDRYIDTSTYYLTMQGTGTLVQLLRNTGTGTAQFLRTVSGTVLAIKSATGVGIQIETGAAIGVGIGCQSHGVYSEQGDASIFNQSSNAIADQIQAQIELHRTGAGSFAGGGLSIEFYTGLNSVGTDKLGFDIASYYADTTNGAEETVALFRLLTGGSLIDVLKLTQGGQAQLSQYGTGAFTGTAAYNLAVDASGNLIEVTPSGGGSAGEIEGTIKGAFRSYRNCTAHRPVPGSNILWVASQNDNRVDVFDATTGETIAYIALTAPAGLLYIDGFSEMWVTLAGSGTVYRYDATTATSAGTITGSGNGGISYYEYSATKVFIANSSSNTVTVLNPTTGATDATITAATLGVAQCTSICFVDEATSAHYGYIGGVSNSDSKFFAINASTNAVAISGTSISTNSPSSLSIDYNPVNDRYYISSYSGQNLGRYIPATSSTITFEYSHATRLTREVRVNKTTGKVYVTSLIGSGTGLNGLVAVQCFDDNGILWSLPTVSDASATSYFAAFLSLDTTDDYLYVNGVSLVATNYPMVTKIKI